MSKDTNIRECESCYLKVSIDDELYTLTNGYKVCEDCMNKVCEKCDSCGEYFLPQHLVDRGTCWEDEVKICHACLYDAAMDATYDSLRYDN